MRIFRFIFFLSCVSLHTCVWERSMDSSMKHSDCMCSWLHSSSELEVTIMEEEEDILVRMLRPEGLHITPSQIYTLKLQCIYLIFVLILVLDNIGLGFTATYPEIPFHGDICTPGIPSISLYFIMRLPALTFDFTLAFKSLSSPSLPSLLFLLFNVNSIYLLTHSIYCSCSAGVTLDGVGVDIACSLSAIGPSPY